MHAQRRVTHQRDVNAASVTVHLVLIKHAVVLAQANAVTDRFAQSHVMIEMMRPARPGTGQPISRRRQRRAHDVVLGVPLGQPAPKHHHKDGPRIRIHDVRAPDLVVVAMGPQTAHARVTARAAAVGPEITIDSEQCDPLFVERRVGRCVGGEDVRRSKKRREVAIAAGGKRLTSENAEPIADQRATWHCHQTLSERMVFVEILAQQFQLAGKSRRTVPGQSSGQVGEIHASYFQFHIRRNRVLVEDTVAVAVSPVSIHVAIKHVGRHRPGLMPVHVQIAGTNDGDMAEQEDRLHVGGIGGVVRLYECFDVDWILVAGHAVAQDLPAIADQVLIQTSQLRAQIRSVSVINEEHHFAAVFNERRLDAGVEVAVTCVVRGGFDYLILVGRADRDVGIDKTRRGPWKSDSVAP